MEELELQEGRRYSSVDTVKEIDTGPWEWGGGELVVRGVEKGTGKEEGRRERYRKGERSWMYGGGRKVLRKGGGGGLKIQEGLVERYRKGGGGGAGGDWLGTWKEKRFIGWEKGTGERKGEELEVQYGGGRRDMQRQERGRPEDTGGARRKVQERGRGRSWGGRKVQERGRGRSWEGGRKVQMQERGRPEDTGGARRKVQERGRGRSLR